MSHVKKLVTRSVVSSLDTQFSAVHENNVNNTNNPYKRVVARSLHAMALANLGVAARCVGFNMENARADFIGMGYDSAVFLKGDQVTKLHLESLEMGRRKQERYAEAKNEGHQALVSRLSSFMLEQTISVGKLPYSSRRSVAYTKQPYRNTADTGIFNTSGFTINGDAVDKLLASNPNSRGQLNKFVEQSLDCYQQTGYTPDVIGHGNLGMDESGNLIMTDGYPFNIDNLVNVSEAISQLQALGQYLDSSNRLPMLDGANLNS